MVLAIAGAYNGNEITSWTEDQRALHTAQQRESFSTWTGLVWWKWSTGRHHNKSGPHVRAKPSDFDSLCSLCRRELKFDVIGSLVRALANLPGGIGRFLPCRIGSHMSRFLAAWMESVFSWAYF